MLRKVFLCGLVYVTKCTDVQSTGDSAPEPIAPQAVDPPASEPLVEGIPSAIDEQEADMLDASDFDDLFLEEWQSKMKNFNPDLLVTVPVGARSDEFFYEDVTKVGTLIRGACFVIGAENDEAHTGIDFVVTDPDGQIVYEARDKIEGVFSHSANKFGTYTIMIGNHKWMSTKQVTVLMGVGEHNALKPQDVDNVTDGFSRVELLLKEIQSESSYLWIKQKSHMKVVQNINSRVYWYYLLEFLLLIVVSSVQIYYVRSLLSNRRLF